MNRDVTCHLELSATGSAELILSVAVAQGVPLAHESLVVRANGTDVSPVEIRDDHRTRLHRVHVEAGTVLVDYAARVDGLAAPAPVTDADQVRYLRQSRYCESDRLAPTADEEFPGLEGMPLLTAVVEWVHQRVRYVSGSSTGTDSALDTLLAREGVCRDFAHLAIALLRARGIPARLASVYAPGLSPMEFHAVAEALVEDAWWVVDATKHAPRQSLVRVATGRDAADTAFLTSLGGQVDLVDVAVTAVAEDFSVDDHVASTQLR